MTSHRYLHCIYAEDVRQELSGQTSIVGMFQGGLKLPAMPGVLVKFFVFATLYLPLDSAPSTVIVEVLMQGKVINTVESPAELLRDLGEKKEKEDLAGHALQMVIGFMNLPITEPGKIEVRAIVDGEVIKGNSLLIEKGDPQLEIQLMHPSTS